jgi:hypothetical protein
MAVVASVYQNKAEEEYRREIASTHTFFLPILRVIGFHG